MLNPSDIQFSNKKWVDVLSTKNISFVVVMLKLLSSFFPLIFITEKFWQEKVAQLRGIDGGNSSAKAPAPAEAPETSPDPDAAKPVKRRVRGKTAAAERKRSGALGWHPLFPG